MATMVQRLAPRLASRPAFVAVCAVVGALVAARFWAFNAIPGRVDSLWGPYFVGPLGWTVAAVAALHFYRGLDAVPAAEHTVERRMVLGIAALVGLFLVAVQVLVGMLANFGTSPFAHSPRWLFMNFFFAGSTLAAVEVSRATLLRALGRRSLTLALVTSTVFLVVVQLPTALFEKAGFTAQAQFWGGTFLPLAATGLLAGFFVLYGGIRAGLLISAPLVVFQYYSPFLPVADWPVLALAGVAGPAIGLWIAEGLFAAEEGDDEEAGGGFALPSIAWVLTGVTALVIFWFSFGFFGYRPAFVPSHSMEPNINQADVVLLGPVHASQVKVGDIVMYELPSRQRVLHRVKEIRIGESGAREFIFKGDNNNTEDVEPVQDKQLIGSYIGRVPELGWIPIKFNQVVGKVR